MAWGLNKGGSTDLDDIFEPRSSSPIANTGIQVAGVDAAQRYERLSSGSAAATTGFQSGGTDLSGLFCAKGTAGSQNITFICQQGSITFHGLWEGILSEGQSHTFPLLQSIALDISAARGAGGDNPTYGQSGAAAGPGGKVTAVINRPNNGTTFTCVINGIDSDSDNQTIGHPGLGSGASYIMSTDQVYLAGGGGGGGGAGYDGDGTVGGSVSYVAGAIATAHGGAGLDGAYSDVQYYGGAGGTGYVKGVTSYIGYDAVNFGNGSIIITIN